MQERRSELHIIERDVTKTLKSFEESSARWWGPPFWQRWSMSMVTRGRECGPRSSRREGVPLWVIPNLLTGIRFPLAAVLWLAPHAAWYVSSIAALAAVSDVLDGWVARHLRVRAERRGAPPASIERSRQLGAWLDPVCDKIFMASLLALIWYIGHAPMSWLLLVGVRDVVQFVLVILYHVIPNTRNRMTVDYTANALGKLTTIAQFITATLLLFDVDGSFVACWATGVLGLITVGHYTRRTVTRGG